MKKSTVCIATTMISFLNCSLVDRLQGLASPVLASPPPLAQVKDVVDHLVGQMDTSAQVATHPKMVAVRMTTCQIEVPTPPPDSLGAVYLYQEQALVDHLAQPYRQRVLRLLTVSDQTAVESKAYKLKAAESWIGLCNKPMAERVIPYQTLQAAQCSVFLKPYLGIYVGETQPGGCPTQVRGATTITNFIILHSRGMDTRDRGFDAQGKQVWGSEQDAYEYRWLTLKQTMNVQDFGVSHR